MAGCERSLESLVRAGGIRRGKADWYSANLELNGNGGGRIALGLLILVAA